MIKLNKEKRIMENNNNMNELEQMREQMQVLRSKLDKQEIINDQQISSIVKSKMSWIKKFVYIQFCLLPVLALLWIGIKEIAGLSWMCIAFMMVMSIIDAIWDYRINVVSLKMEKVAENSLAETMHKLIDMKQMRTKSFCIMLPLLVLWLAWVGVEMWQNISLDGTFDSALGYALKGGFVGLIIGGIAGLFVSFRIYRKMQRTNDELISQLKEISENN